MSWPETRLTIDGELVAAEEATYPNIDPSTGQEMASQPTPHRPISNERSCRPPGVRRERMGDDVALLRGLRQLDAALRDHLAEMTEITMAEVGAPQAACDVAHLGEPLKFLPYYADLAESFEWTTPLGIADTVGGPAERWTEREPIGVVAAITPWNVPTQINLAKTAPALAAGCTVVLKPAPQTPWRHWRSVDRHRAHRHPPGVFNVISAADPTIGALLTEDPRVDMISFTGSTATGRPSCERRRSM